MRVLRSPCGLGRHCVPQLVEDGSVFLLQILAQRLQLKHIVCLQQLVTLLLLRLLLARCCLRPLRRLSAHCDDARVLRPRKCDVCYSAMEMHKEWDVLCFSECCAKRESLGAASVDVGLRCAGACNMQRDLTLS